MKHCVSRGQWPSWSRMERTCTCRKISSISNKKCSSCRLTSIKRDNCLVGRLQQFKDELQGEFSSEFSPYSSNIWGDYRFLSSIDKGKGVLGGPRLGFPTKDSISMGLTSPLGPTRIEIIVPSYKLKCSHFNNIDFKGWWAKFKQFFEAERIPSNARVRTVMLHLEGKVFEWYHFFA